MPRISRKNLQSMYYHVIVQGINKEYIFEKDRFKEAYISLLKKYAEDSGVMILAYCIMDNHAHIMIFCEKIEYMIKLMRKVNTSFALLYNGENKRVGYVFRDRYNTQMILTENQLYNCMVYIHKNPVKADMVSKMQDYRYSSYNEYKRIINKRLITKKSIKLVFGSEKNYMEMFNMIHNRDNIEDVIEVKERKDATTIIRDFLTDNNTNLKEIINDESKFRELVLRLRHEGRNAFKRNGKSARIWEKQDFKDN